MTTPATNHPHHRQWWQSMLAEINQHSKLIPPAALPETEEPMFQEDQAEKPKSDMTQCEYCGAVIKDKKQARAVHLRWCEPYIASKAGSEAAPANGSKPRKNGHPPAASKTNGAVITVAPDRVAKLWNIMSGGTLVIEADDETGQIQCHISRSSLDSLIEGMIDRL